MSFMLPLAMGGLGAASGFFGTPDYSGAADQYAGQMGQLAQTMSPYEKQGQMAKYGALGLGAYQMENPAGLQNRLASSYQNSPYQQQILGNTANMMNANAANTGMLGSTAQQGALQNQMAGMQNQFQQQYIDRGTQQYNLANQNVNRMATLMAQQGFSGQQIADELQAQGYMAQMQAAMMPSSTQNMITGAISGITGGIM